jgi:hypothetical protein
MINTLLDVPGQAHDPLLRGRSSSAEILGAMFIRTSISVFTRLGDVCEFARELAMPRVRHLEFG